MRELTKNQKKLIRNEVLRNKLLGYENPFEIATNVFFKIQEMNDFETYFDHVQQYLDDLKEEAYRREFMPREFGHKK
jgi:hypothetical protein